MQQNADTRWRAIRLDLLIATVLAAILTVGWAVNDWSRLSRLLLPDPDDMMRLAQVRDWLAGQGINDWTQYRMAPPLGSPMHWSRVNDVGIAALILAATPFVGQWHAELVAVLLYPAFLFAGALFLSARIGRRLWGNQAGPIAAILTALAYPGTTVFVPGRIDHHALQVVLIQSLVLLTMRAPSLRSGIVAGITAAISLVVGLETAPQVAALLATIAIIWVVRGTPERARLTGFAAGLGGTTLAFLICLRPTLWSAHYCDAFTPASSTGTMATAVALAVLGAATPLLGRWQTRLAAGAGTGVIAVTVTLALFPACLSGPYGVMDPFLLKFFLPFIDEAAGVLNQPRFARIVAISGVPVAASVATVWMLLRTPRRWARHAPIAAVILSSGLILLFQVRGAYIGAPLGATVLAGLVVRARARQNFQVLGVLAAWLLGSGMAYVTIAEQVEKRFGRHLENVNRPTLQVVCSAGDTWARVNRLPAGIVMAGTNVAAYIIGATHHSTIGAGYHRNDAGNMAMYRFFLSRPERSRQIGREWKTTYVAFCPGDFSEIAVERRYPGSLAADLARDRPPPWLVPIDLGSTLRFYRVVDAKPLF